MQQEIEIEAFAAGLAHPQSDAERNSDNEECLYRRGSYGKNLVDLWVFGMYKSKAELRYCIVSDRKVRRYATLLTDSANREVFLCTTSGLGTSVSVILNYSLYC